MPRSNMKNLLKKLHIMPNQSEDVNGLVPSKGSRLNEGSSEKMSSCRSSPSRSSPSHSDQKSFSSLSGWLSSGGNKHSPSPSSSSNVRIEETDFSDSVSSSSGRGVVLDTRQESKLNNSRDPDMDEEYQIQLALEMSTREDPNTFVSSIARDTEVEEEYQIQLALEISAREDPEAVQIEAVKQISLASCPPQNTPAEIIAYRYWSYDGLGYDDKILDGFYDLYDILAESWSAKMPSLVDLQGTPVSDTISWEAVLVNRASDANLVALEQKALVMTVEFRSEFRDSVDTHLVQALATLVADYMGGPVGSPESMLKSWRDHSNTLRATLNSMVLPLGSLTIGLARHRALLFKVLADSVGIPCRLMKGRQYTGPDDMAVNIVKTDDISREYIIDLMAAPGTLIPFDAAGTQIEYGKPFFAVTPSLSDVDFTHRPSSSGVVSSIKEYSEFDKSDNILSYENHATSENDLNNRSAINELQKVESSQESLSNAEKCEVESKLLEDRFRFAKALVEKSPKRPSHPVHTRSPSWTEGISSPAVRRMKVKDVSLYMIDAAKENPDLAQKLHDVLLESGVVAPPNLFSEIYTEQQGVLLIEDKKRIEDKDPDKDRSETRRVGEPGRGAGQYFTPFPFNDVQSKASPLGNKPELKHVESLVIESLPNLDQMTGLPVTVAVSTAATEVVAASSAVSAAVKSSTVWNVHTPVVAAASSRQTEHGVQLSQDAGGLHQMSFAQSDKNVDISGCEPQGTSDKEHVARAGAESSHGSAGNNITKSDIALNDVAEWEIRWEEITLGERIGLGSCGEVYRGYWHETDVAVKKFLNQDISRAAREEFISEVRIMKRLRHPNVVLFMGAVPHAPTLSIVTEFLPRGSLYRLIHHPNSQLDERRRLRMALDVARGMNYLHNCTPVIVHRDLKSPNLLVDKNWVVKVSDFGLSRMKHSTFLSSRSTAGTAEWMAPEVLRNELSDEKCDVYSFGVILWELSTLQQPWGGLNPMQVVGAVGFQHRRLDIPADMDPAIADIVIRCWQTDPRSRPSFSEIIAALRPLQKPITNTQAPRLRVPTNTSQKKGNV